MHDSKDISVIFNNFYTLGLSSINYEHVYRKWLYITHGSLQKGHNKGFIFNLWLIFVGFKKFPFLYFTI